MVIFAQCTHKAFLESKKFYDDYQFSLDNDEGEEVLIEKENQYKDSIPKIEFQVYVEYDKTDNGKLTSIYPFLMDLDRKDAFILCEYGIFKSEEFSKLSVRMPWSIKNDFLLFCQKEENLF